MSARTAEPALHVTETPDGARLVRSAEPLAPYARRLPDHLARWAALRPGRVFLGQREGEGGAWRTVTYEESLRRVRSLAQALLDRGLSAERGVAILSENGIDHALLGLAAQYAGIPYVPVSPPYSLRSQDFARLRYILELTAPGLVYVDDGARYARALMEAVPAGTQVVVSSNPPSGRDCLEFDVLLATRATPVVETARAAVEADTIAKILFTSGSTGMPKGVIVPQRMLCSNPQQVKQVFPFVADDLVMLDWAPWHHTAGGNHDFGLVLSCGGTLYVDDGRPTPGDSHKTVRNLRDIAPTIFFNVPIGYEQLAGVLESDRALCERFFSRLQMAWYAGAAMSAPLWNRFRDLARKARGEELLMVTGLGATETGPSVLYANWPCEEPGNVGVPVPGVEIKLVPSGPKLELRVRGPAVTPGYFKRDDLTRAAFDDDGFFSLGDAVRPVDPRDYRKGFLFDGRLAEDFKLGTGTWVAVAPLRAEVLRALAPLVGDLVICGHDRDDVGALLVLEREAACRYAGLAREVPYADVIRHPAVREFVRERLGRHAAEQTGSSSRVVRASFLQVPPSLDAGEITDKGSLSSAVILAQNALLIEEMYAPVPPERAIVID